MCNTNIFPSRSEYVINHKLDKKKWKLGNIYFMDLSASQVHQSKEIVSGTLGRCQRPVQQSEHSRLFVCAHFWMAVFAIVKKGAHANYRERSLLLNRSQLGYTGPHCISVYMYLISQSTQKETRTSLTLTLNPVLYANFCARTWCYVYRHGQGLIHINCFMWNFNSFDNCMYTILYNFVML
jgi:hypothetical protein